MEEGLETVPIVCSVVVTAVSVWWTLRDISKHASQILEISLKAAVIISEDVVRHVREIVAIAAENNGATS